MVKQKKWVSILGIIIIGLSLSYTHYLFPLPFKPDPGVQRLAKEAGEFPEVIKEILDISGMSQKDLENKFMKERIFHWVLSTLFIALGIAAGISILRRKNYGRIYVISFSLFLILFKIWTILKSYPYVVARLKYLYVISMKKQPLLVIRNEILIIVICIIIIIYFTRPPVVSEFKNNQ